MACEICGRSACIRSFHSFEEQEKYDEVADKIKDDIKRQLINEVNRIEGNYSEDDYYIKLDDVIQVIEDYY